MTSHDVGLEGEQQAREYLARRGIEVIGTRYRAGGGEIDIIAREKGELCFIEVKYRPHGRLGEGMSAVTPDKWEKMRHAAKFYLASCGKPARYRFDLIEITRAGVWHVRAARPGR